MMVRESLFFKANGTIFDVPRERAAFIASMTEFATRNPECLIYIVPGGGQKVDELRELHATDPARVSQAWQDDHDEVLEPERAAHWRAIEIMDELGIDLAKDLQPCSNIIIPGVARFLRANASNLPESWDITSDSILYSIAATFAGETDDLPWIILLKRVDGVIDAGKNTVPIPRRLDDVTGNIVKTITVNKGKPRPLLPSYPFDMYLFVLVQRHKIPFYIVNWRHIERVDTLLRRILNVTCTKIMPVI